MYDIIRLIQIVVHLQNCAAVTGHSCCKDIICVVFIENVFAVPRMRLIFRCNINSGVRRCNTRIRQRIIYYIRTIILLIVELDSVLNINGLPNCEKRIQLVRSPLHFIRRNLCRSDTGRCRRIARIVCIPCEEVRCRCFINRRTALCCFRPSQEFISLALRSCGDIYGDIDTDVSVGIIRFCSSSIVLIPINVCR